MDGDEGGGNEGSGDAEAGDIGGTLLVSVRWAMEDARGA
jgi:hypothetical protein